MYSNVKKVVLSWPSLQFFILFKFYHFLEYYFPFQIRDKIDVRWCIAWLWCIPAHVRPVSIIELSSQKETPKFGHLMIGKNILLKLCYWTYCNSDEMNKYNWKCENFHPQLWILVKCSLVLSNFRWFSINANYIFE